MRRYKILSLILILIIILTTACGLKTKNNTNGFDTNLKEIDNYSIRLLVIYDEENYLPLYQHLKQSLIVGLQVESISVDLLADVDWDNYDILYLSPMDLDNKDVKKLRLPVSKLVAKGGTLILPQDMLKDFPTTYTGLGKTAEIDINIQELEYPEVGEDLQGIQKIAKAFEEDYRKYINKELKIQTAEVKDAKVIVGYKDQALISVKEYKQGKVIVLSNFLPNYQEYSTGFDLISREEKKNYFQFFYATGNYQLLNELVTYLAKDQYGFAFKKVLGTYGRPAMAWQNHYEALESIANKELVSWIDILKQHNQIPSISLVRGSYDWGEWHNTITYHLNVGDNQNPKFRGEEENSYYSNGFYIQDKNNQDITLEKYPESVSYYSKVEKNFRPYPYFIDWNQDGKIDIVVGNHDGRIAVLKNVGTKERPRYGDPIYLKHTNGKEINLGENTAPTVVDFNGNGLYDLIVGNKAGKVYLLVNTEKGFLPPQPLTTKEGKEIAVSGEAAPFVGDINGNGIPDLILGEETGKVYVYEGFEGQIKSFKGGQQLIVDGKPLKVEGFAAPHIGDYNGDSKMDLLVGDATGSIHVYSSENQQTSNDYDFIYKGKVVAERKNIYGENTIYTGKNVVPFLLDWDEDGKIDLITGQLSFAKVYDLSLDDFPYKKELQANLNYAQQHHVPIFPHIYFHSHKDNELEKREIELHQESFKRLGLFWKYTGTNQHTWRVNIDNPTQSFKNLMEYNIWNNFGFKTPNAPTDPNFGRDYIWSTPFIMMEGEEFLPMVLFTPSPFIRTYGEVYDHLAEMDTPFTFFEHIEYKITRGGSGLEHLMAMINFSEEVREKYNYAFMTEEQMAKAFMNAFYTDYDIDIVDKQITITPNTERVPKHLVEEFVGTGGLRVELGGGFKDHILTSDALIQYRQGEQFYVGVDKTINLSIHEELPLQQEEEQLQVLMVNGSIQYEWSEEELTINFTSKGLNQIKLFSKVPLKIEGKNIKIEEKEKIYTITHYGESLQLKITPQN